MKRVRRSAAILSLCLFVGLPAPSLQKDDSLIEQSFGLSEELGGREQFYYLVEFCRVSVSLNSPWAKTKEAALRLFDLSTNQDATLSTIGQKNAVDCLSYVDPLKAMDLLVKVSFHPQATWVYEDPRYNAAETTFENFLNYVEKKDTSGHEITASDVSKIITTARYLGRTGQYPYFGVAKVINRLPAVFQKQANTLLDDAVEFYTNETGFYNRDEEFLRLLRILYNSAIDKQSFAQALGKFVERLQNKPIRFPGDYYAEIHLRLSGKAFPFTERNDAFLFQAFPMIRRFSPNLAAQLLQQDPQLDEATEQMDYISGGFVQGDPTSEQAAQHHYQWLQQSLLNRIEEIKRRPGCNQEVAASLAQRLTDTSSRIVAFSMVIPGVARNQPLEAQRIYANQLTEINNLDDSVAKLRAAVALASAANDLGDVKRSISLSTEALEMGIRIFKSDDKAPRVGRREGFGELRDLATLAGSQPVDPLKTKVQQLPDELKWLKAYLLMYEDAGHREPKDVPATTTPCPA